MRSPCWDTRLTHSPSAAWPIWMPAFLERARGIPRSEATVNFGTIVVVTGFVGTFVGGWMGDYFAKNSRQAYLWLSADATLVAAPFVWLALTTTSTTHVHRVHGDGATLLVPVHRSDQRRHHQSRHRQRAGHGNRAERVRHSCARRCGLAIDRRRALGCLLAGGRPCKILPVAVLVGGFVWVWAARAQAASSPSPSGCSATHVISACVP